jgi:hypothetical protein
MRNHLAHTRGLWAGQSEDDAGDAAEHASTVG